MENLSEEQKRLAYTDPKGFIGLLMREGIFNGAVSSDGRFTGTVNFNQLTNSLQEYLTVKVQTSSSYLKLAETQKETSEMLVKHIDAESEVEKLKARIAELEQLISEKPRCDTMVHPTFQRMWEACNTLVEKAQFKFIVNYIEGLEKRVQEIAATAAETTQQLLNANSELHKLKNNG